MPEDPATLANAIRRSLAAIYALSDEELCMRDSHMHALFHAVGRGASFTRGGAAAFESLARLTLGAPLPTT